MFPPTRKPNVCDLESAMDMFGDMVYRLAYARLQNKADAEDVYQSVFLQLYKSNCDFANAEHQKAWLLRVTSNACTDLTRQHNRKPEVTWDAQDMPEPHQYVQATNTSRVQDELDEAMAHLTDEQRGIVHLHYYEGFSAQEIGRILGENPVTVRTHLMRARKALKISLESSRGSTYEKVVRCVSINDYEAPRSPSHSL